jgi:hypothetical protein
MLNRSLLLTHKKSSPYNYWEGLVIGGNNWVMLVKIDGTITKLTNTYIQWVLNCLDWTKYVCINNKISKITAYPWTLQEVATISGTPYNYSTVYIKELPDNHIAVLFRTNSNISTNKLNVIDVTTGTIIFNETYWWDYCMDSIICDYNSKYVVYGWGNSSYLKIWYYESNNSQIMNCPQGVVLRWWFFPIRGWKYITYSYDRTTNISWIVGGDSFPPTGNSISISNIYSKCYISEIQSITNDDGRIVLWYTRSWTGLLCCTINNNWYLEKIDDVTLNTQGSWICIKNKYGVPVFLGWSDNNLFMIKKWDQKFKKLEYNISSSTYLYNLRFSWTSKIYFYSDNNNVNWCIYDVDTDEIISINPHWIDKPIKSLSTLI